MAKTPADPGYTGEGAHGEGETTDPGWVLRDVGEGAAVFFEWDHPHLVRGLRLAELVEGLISEPSEGEAAPSGPGPLEDLGADLLGDS